METEETKKIDMEMEENQNEVAVSAPQGDSPVDKSASNKMDSRRHAKNPRKSAPRREVRPKSEFDQKIISIRRVTRVVTGGRRFSFSVAVVVGDRKGRVGVGQGKAGDTPVAIDKAVRDAKKHLITVKLDKKLSIMHDVEAKYSASRVMIMKAPGKGILAGSSVRVVLELAGIKEVNAKLISGSKNKINNAKAAIKALSKIAVKK